MRRIGENLEAEYGYQAGPAVSDEDAAITLSYTRGGADSRLSNASSEV